MQNNPNHTPPRRWYDYENAADYLGLSVRQVRRATAAGAIGFTRLGGLRVYFSQAQLDQYVADCTVAPKR
jgi:excisionase family DNA binding protein